jgi:urease accessory protein
VLRFTQVLDAPPAADARARAVRLRLRHDERARSRLAAMTVDGQAAAVVLPRGTVLADGTFLAGDDGALALVEAAPQALARISAASPLALLRAVYHLANRHVAAQLTADAVLIERDAVLEAMLASHGAQIEHVEAPFEPEAGAYHGGHGHALHDDDAAGSASIGEQLSIAAHARRGAAR